MQNTFGKTKDDKNTVTHELDNLSRYNQKLKEENSKLLNETTRIMNKTNNKSSLWLPDTFSRLKEIELMSTQHLVDRIIVEQHLTNLNKGNSIHLLMYYYSA